MAATAPWLDQYAPAQWTIGLPQTTTGPTQVAGPNNGIPLVNSSATAFDTTVHLKVAGTIILGLVVIFGLQAMGFRFVTSANVSIGGR